MKYYLLFIAFFFNLKMIAQIDKEKEAKEVLTYNYKYLDKDFKINIPNNVYQETVEKYKFYPERVINKKHSDSLGVVLMAEFKDWKKANKASFILNYSYKRISYHLWNNEENIKKMAENYKIKSPYLFNLFLRNETNHDENLKKYFSDLRNNVYCKTNDEKVKTMDISSLMNFAMKNSPQRIEDFQTMSYEKKHGVKPNRETKLGEGCGKKDCCQLKKAN